MPAAANLRWPDGYVRENYEWLPDRGTIFTVVSKADGTVVARAQGEPFLGIHQINCFERDDAIVFDVPAYPEGPVA